VFAITPDFRIVSANATGALASMSSVYQTNYAYFGIDLNADPLGNGSPMAHANCLSSDWWRVNFYPAALASVVFMNRAGKSTRQQPPDAMPAPVHVLHASPLLHLAAPCTCLQTRT
jgi:hypothetical protein